MKRILLVSILLIFSLSLFPAKIHKIGIHPKVVTVTDNRYTVSGFENSSATDTNARSAGAANIEAAVAMLDGHGGIIYVECESMVYDDLTIPSNIRLILLPTAAFSIAATKTLTFNCYVDGDIVATGSGTVAYGDSYDSNITSVGIAPLYLEPPDATAGGGYGLKLVSTSSFQAAAAHKALWIDHTHTPSTTGTACPIAIVGKLNLAGNNTATNSYPGMGFGVQGQVNINTGSTINGSTFGGALYTGLRGVVTDGSGTSTYTKGNLAGLYSEIQMNQANANDGADFNIYGIWSRLQGVATSTNMAAGLYIDANPAFTNQILVGVDINDCVTGIDIGECTTDIILQNDETITNAVDGTVAVSGTISAPAFTATSLTATDQDVGIFTYGTWTQDADHDKNIVGQTAHFVPFQAHLSADTSVAKDIAAARFRVDTGINTTGAIGNLQLRQSLAHNVGSSANINASTSIDDAVTVGTGSILGGYFSIEGTGAITKAGANDCTPLVAVNNNTGGGVDNVLIAMQNGTGTTVDEILLVTAEHGTATVGLNITEGSGTITTDIALQNGETIDNATDGTVAIGGILSATSMAATDITVGAAKTLDVSAGTLTLADNQISGDKVEGGTIAATTITALTSTTINTGGAGAAAASGNVAVENSMGTFHSTVLTLNAVPIEPAAAGAGIAFDYVKLYDFPAGYIYLQGIVADLALTDATVAGSELAGNFATWTAPAGPATWDYDSTTAGEWHHATGDATALVTDVVAVSGTTYHISITMATTTAGGGLVVSMGGVTQGEIHGSDTVTFDFTASATTALTFTPDAGTWVGDITSITVNTVTPISTTWDGDIAFGTTADADGSLASTEVDMVPSTGTTQAIAGVAAADCQSTATEHAIFDGHTDAKDLILNLLIDAADFVDAGTGAVTISGTVTITWINLGDN